MKTTRTWLVGVALCSFVGCAANGQRIAQSNATLPVSVVQPDTSVEGLMASNELTDNQSHVAGGVQLASSNDDGPIKASSNVVTATVDPMASVPNDPMNSMFVTGNSTTVDELVDLALTNNPAIKELAATTQKAAGFRTQVGLYANPLVGYQAQQLADRGTDQHILFAEQEFATANKLGLNRRVQNEALRAQLQELEAQKLRVATDIRTLYYEALGYQKQLTLIQEFRTLMDKGYDLAQLRLKAAEGSKIDVLQTKVQRSEIDLVYRQTRARYDAAWRGIAATTGINNLQPTLLSGEFSETVQPMRWDELSTRLVASSPEYAAAQARISQARAELERHGVQAVPNLIAQLGAGVDNGTNSGMINFQVGAPIPVFNKNQGNIAAARAEYCRALMEAKRIENAIQARLAIVSRDFDSAMEATNVYSSEILPGAQEALTLSESAYKAGEISFVQVLVARRTYFESSLQYVNAQAQLAAAQAKVDGFMLSGALDAVIDRSGSDSLRGLTFGQQ